MGIFGYIAKKKDEFRAKKLEIQTNKAKILEEKAEKNAKDLEKIAQHNKALNEALKRQEKAKAVINESRRLQHPFLYKIGENVKQNFANAKKKKSSASLSNNIFNKNQDYTPYWMKQSKKKDNRPYWLR